MTPYLGTSSSIADKSCNANPPVEIILRHWQWVPQRFLLVASAHALHGLQRLAIFFVSAFKFRYIVYFRASTDWVLGVESKRNSIMYNKV